MIPWLGTVFDPSRRTGLLSIESEASSSQYVSKFAYEHIVFDIGMAVSMVKTNSS